jgi:hypothetical protein
MQTAGRRSVSVAIAPLAVAVAVAGCGGGSGGGGKPQYCADRSKLEQSVKDVASTKVLEQGGIQDLKKRLQTVESDARTLVSSAKGDFPKETGAIQSSVSTLKASAQKLGSSPTPQQVGTLAKDAKAVVTSFQSFKKASDSKC